MTVTHWEHKLEVIRLPSGRDDGETARAEAVSHLNELGAEGWEVVGFSPSHASSHGLRVETTEYVVLMKRSPRSR